MEITLNKEEYTNLLRVVAQEALIASPIKRQTGALLNSVQVTVNEDGYVLSFNDYGLFLDEGVRGTLRGVSGQGFIGQTFAFSGKFKMIGGNLPIGARVNIYKFGITPRPWVEEAINNIEKAAAAAIELEITEEIEETLVNTIKFLGTAGKITFSV